jgi:hypothetical protein
MERLNWVMKHEEEYDHKWVKLHLTNCHIDRNRTLLRTLWPAYHMAKKMKNNTETARFWWAKILPSVIFWT